jgi:hypothetical protein
VNWLSIALALTSVLVLAGLLLALRWRGRAPAWLPLVGVVAVVTSILVAIFDSHLSGIAVLFIGAIPWCLAGCALLLVATLAIARRWGWRTPVLITAFAVLAPVAFAFLVVALSNVSA